MKTLLICAVTAYLALSVGCYSSEETTLSNVSNQPSNDTGSSSETVDDTDSNEIDRDANIADQESETDEAVSDGPKIEWAESMEAALELSEKEGRPVIAYFTYDG